MNTASGVPLVAIYDHTESDGEAASFLREKSPEVIRACLARSGSPGAPRLAALRNIEVSLVTDSTIAEVHERFMGDPEPTDVITFPHGEILISLETASRRAVEFGHFENREALLYLIHGLLHLNGFDDQTTEERRKMDSAQRRILDAISPFPEAKDPG